MNGVLAAKQIYIYKTPKQIYIYICSLVESLQEYMMIYGRLADEGAKDFERHRNMV
jgi:hypothetical protein